MKTYIILLKGINVGGHKKVPMAELRELLTKEGFQNLKTYIQSGNVVLQSSETASKVEAKMQKAIKSHFGFEVSVIVKTNKELQAIFDASPFSKNTKEKSYFIMFNKTPDKELLKEVESISFENEEVILKKDALYFYSSVGYGNAKFNMNTYEKKLKVTGTARNFNTMVKLLSLSEEA
ncbi:MAG: DUF1697 domain-containing protein [Gelidibacter sp.]